MGTKIGGICVQQILCALWREGPHHRPRMAVFTANGQEGQDFGAMCGLKPLTRYLVVRFRGLNAAGQRVLCVMLDFKVHTQLCTRLAGASFADHGEGGRCRLGHLFNVGLISHCLR